MVFFSCVSLCGGSLPLLRRTEKNVWNARNLLRFLPLSRERFYVVVPDVYGFWRRRWPEGVEKSENFPSSSTSTWPRHRSRAPWRNHTDRCFSEFFSTVTRPYFSFFVFFPRYFGFFSSSAYLLPPSYFVLFSVNSNPRTVHRKRKPRTSTTDTGRRTNRIEQPFPSVVRVPFNFGLRDVTCLKRLFIRTAGFSFSNFGYLNSPSYVILFVLPSRSVVIVL